jgi:16S rRNA processing protein RimM
MKIDACFQLGFVTGTYGLNGEVHVFLDSDQPNNYRNLESVFLLQKGGNDLVPFFVRKISLQGDRAIVQLEDVASKDQARKLVGSTIYLPLDHLPELKGDDFYYHELVNWQVVDQTLGELGVVSSINLQSPQPLLIMEYKNREVLIPFTDNIVMGIDRNQNRVNVALPEGLLEVYIE